MLVHRIGSKAPRSLVIAAAALVACGSAPPPPTRIVPSEQAARGCPEPSVAADAGSSDTTSAEATAGIDFGDGSMNIVLNAARRTLTVESLPPIDMDVSESLECLHVTGLAGVHDETPPVLVVLSVLYGPETCGTMLGRSFVYRFDGRAWTKVATTVASELHLRQDGPDIVEWKLVSAETPYDGSKWAKIPRRKFPPAEPRATAIRSYGFEKP